MLSNRKHIYKEFSLHHFWHKRIDAISIIILVNISLTWQKIELRYKE